jgi:hypothetical protein
VNSCNANATRRDDDAFLRGKVEASRASMRAARGVTHEALEADFAARCAKAISEG